MSKLRVAVLGAKGRIGSEAVRAVEAAEDMELVAALGRGDKLETLDGDRRPGRRRTDHPRLGDGQPRVLRRGTASTPSSAPPAGPTNAWRS